MQKVRDVRRSRAKWIPWDSFSHSSEERFALFPPRARSQNGYLQEESYWILSSDRISTEVLFSPKESHRTVSSWVSWNKNSVPKPMQQKLSSVFFFSIIFNSVPLEAWHFDPPFKPSVVSDSALWEFLQFNQLSELLKLKINMWEIKMRRSKQMPKYSTESLTY